MDNNLTQTKLFDLLNQVLEQVPNIVPGDTDDSKKKWISKGLRELVEVFDNHIPIIGEVMDMPMMDEVEEQIVDIFVNWAWDGIKQKIKK